MFLIYHTTTAIAKRVYSQRKNNLLKQKYPIKSEERRIINVHKKITNAENMAKTSLSAVSDHIFKHLYKHKNKLSQEEFILHIYALVWSLFSVVNNRKQGFLFKILLPCQEVWFDHVKLLVKTKDNIDSFQGLAYHGIGRIQLYGLELHKYSLRHETNALYVNNGICRVFIHNF